MKHIIIIFVCLFISLSIYSQKIDFYFDTQAGITSAVKFSNSISEKITPGFGYITGFSANYNKQKLLIGIDMKFKRISYYSFSMRDAKYIDGLIFIGKKIKKIRLNTGVTFNLSLTYQKTKKIFSEFNNPEPKYTMSIFFQPEYVISNKLIIVADLFSDFLPSLNYFSNSGTGSTIARIDFSNGFLIGLKYKLF